VIAIVLAILIACVRAVRVALAVCYGACAAFVAIACAPSCSFRRWLVAARGCMPPPRAAVIALLLVAALVGSVGAQTLPVEHWKLDEASGQFVGVVNAYHMTEQSGTVDAATGKVSGGRDFEAIDTEYAEVADNANLSGGNRTFGGTFWVRPETVSGVIADKGWQSASDTSREWILWFNTTTTIRFTMQNGGFVRDLTSTTPSISTGTWYFVCFWYDANTDLMNLQINNGTPVTLGDTLGSYDGTRSFRLGASPGQTLYMDGILDEFSWFAGNFPDSTQRTAMYNAGNGLAYPWSSGTAVPKILLQLSDRLQKQERHFATYGVYALAP
jgi:hypothetical protein